MNWLSVLVPVYNVLPYLSECVESILEQIDGSGDVQILLYDDASTDGSGEFAQQLVQRWPERLSLLRGRKNAGLSMARNRLTDAATGEYLWFVDSDDKLLPGAVASLHQIVLKYAPDVVLCDFQVWRERPRIKHRLRGEQHQRAFAGPSRQLCQDRNLLLAGLLSKGRLHAWSKVSRRTLWRGSLNGSDLNFPPGRSYEDISTIPLLALRAESFYHEPAPWVAYRQRSDSILATPNISKAMDQSSALRDFSRELKSTPSWSDQGARVGLARQAARNLTGAMRVLWRQVGGMQQQEQVVALAEQVRQDFLHTSPLSPDELARWYARRGWWLQRRKFLRWFHAQPGLPRASI